FFFQAEDGIRDDLVTGVQTCALPISSLSISPASTTRVRSRTTPGSSTTTGGRRQGTSATGSTCVRRSSQPGGQSRTSRSPTSRRSEERRVGKEERSRWEVESESRE